MYRLRPIHAEALIIANKDFSRIDRQVVSVAVGDVQGSLHCTESLDVADTETKTNVALIVGLPVLHEVPNILDVHTRARHLP